MTDEITAPFASEKRKLLLNSDKIHTTEMGAARIRRNLALHTEDASDVVLYCTEKIHDEFCAVRRRGKNYYCTVGGITITVNARNFTIITAHRKKS